MKKLLLTLFVLSHFAFGVVTFINTGIEVRTAGGVFSSAFAGPTSGTNCVGIALLKWDNAASLSITTGPTYNGAAMTSMGAADHNGTVYVQGFWIANPTAGSNTLAFTVTGGTVGDTYGNFSNFCNVSQTTPIRPGSYATGGGTATAGCGSGNTAFSLVVSSNVSDLTVSGLNGGLANVVNTNQTLDGTSSAGTDSAADDHATTAAGSVTHTWTCTGTLANSPIAIVGASLQVVGGAAAPAGFNKKQKLEKVDPS